MKGIGLFHPVIKNLLPKNVTVPSSARMHFLKTSEYLFVPHLDNKTNLLVYYKAINLVFHRTEYIIGPAHLNKFLKYRTKFVEIALLFFANPNPSPRIISSVSIAYQLSKQGNLTTAYKMLDKDYRFPKDPLAWNGIGLEYAVTDLPHLPKIHRPFRPFFIRKKNYTYIPILRSLRSPFLVYYMAYSRRNKRLEYNIGPDLLEEFDRRSGKFSHAAGLFFLYGYPPPKHVIRMANASYELFMKQNYKKVVSNWGGSWKDAAKDPVFWADFLMTVATSVPASRFQGPVRRGVSGGGGTKYPVPGSGLDRSVKPVRRRHSPPMPPKGTPQITKATTGGSTYLSPKTDMFVRRWIAYGKRTQGYFDIIVHGSKNGVAIWSTSQHKWFIIRHSSLAKWLKKYGGYTGGPIRLVSCNTGAWANGFAKNLANKTNEIVMAPSDIIWAHPDGTFTIGPTPTKSTGVWNKFFPGNKIPDQYTDTQMKK